MMNGENVNTASLASFNNMVNELKVGLGREYDRAVNRDLSKQRYQQVFRRNVTMVLRETYQQALAELTQLTFDYESRGNELSSKLLQSFDGVIEEFILYALQKHRSSCALSNFPDEHNPSVEYLSEVIDETSRDWSAFSIQVNSMMAG